MKVLIGSAVVGSLAISSVFLYRKAKKWRFRRFLRELPGVSKPTMVGWIQRIEIDQGIALRKVLESQQLSTEKKVEVCEVLVELGNFSRIMKPDYLVRLMLSAESSAKVQVADLALRVAAFERSGLREIVERLDRVSDPSLAVKLLTGLADIAAAIPVGGKWDPHLPSEGERSSVTKHVAYNLAHADEEVRQAAARLLNTTLVNFITEAEGPFMSLLRDGPREVKPLVAELVLANQGMLKAAMCFVRLATHDLPQDLRARI